MKVLVCAASKYEATGEIAQAVADVLAAKGLEVTVVPPGQAGAIEQFDAVVLGSAVDMGQRMKPPANSWSARPPRWPHGRCGCFRPARSASRPSPSAAPSASPRSWRPPGPATIRSSPASWPESTSASLTGPSPQPSAPRKATSATGPRSGMGDRHCRQPACMMTAEPTSGPIRTTVPPTAAARRNRDRARQRAGLSPAARMPRPWEPPQ
jgi:hypothetical protein